MTLNRRGFLLSSGLAVPALGAAGATSACAASPTTPHQRVRTGADRLAAEGWRSLADRRLGVLTNPTGILHHGPRRLHHIVDDMHGRDGIDVVAAFGPEHGFRGTAQAGGSEGDYADPRTGIPVYDAYGADVPKLVAMLRKARVEQLVFDIADVGARFYTYIWSMRTAMLAAAELDLPFTVLDRPNPIGGLVAGGRLDPRFASGVGQLPITQQHGMTVGELAMLFAHDHPPPGARPPRVDVVDVRGWSREQRFTETGLPWVMPSPNMPTPDTAALYPGTGLFEGTVLSEGRGTTRPFEIIGAPGIDWRWAEDLTAAQLPGVEFRETYFVPTFGKHANETCGGVQVSPTGELDPVRVAITMLVTARRRYPGVFGWRPDLMIDKLAGSDQLRTMIDAGADADDVLAAWAPDVADFTRQRQPHLRYS